MKSPLGEVLKIISKRKEKLKINVCSCGSPLVFTFAFAYKEYLCLECGNTYGMMGVRSVEATPELKHKKKLYEKLWNIIYGVGGFFPRSPYTKIKCKKCTADNHFNHVSKTEILKNKIATDIFEKLICSKN